MESSQSINEKAATPFCAAALPQILLLYCFYTLKSIPFPHACRPIPASSSQRKNFLKKIFQNPLTGKPKVIIISLNLQNATIGILSRLPLRYREDAFAESVSNGSPDSSPVSGPCERKEARFPLTSLGRPNPPLSRRKSAQHHPPSLTRPRDLFRADGGGCEVRWYHGVSASSYVGTELFFLFFVPLRSNHSNSVTTTKRRLQPNENDRIPSRDGVPVGTGR